MSRSSWKPTFLDSKLWNASRQTPNKSDPLNFESDLICTKRSTPVLPFMLGKRIHVATGTRLIPFIITAEIIGHRLGEFAATRKRPIPPSTKTSKVAVKGAKK